MSKYLKVIPFVLALLLIGANLLWAPVCPGKLQLLNGNEAAMKCFYTGRTSLILSLIIIIMGFDNLFQKRISVLFFIGIGIILMLLPNSTWGIGVCMKEHMPCLTTALWIKGVGLGSVLYGLAALLIRHKDQVPN